MTIRIKPKLRFSYDFARGSFEQRTLHTEKINENIFIGLLKMYENTEFVKIKNIEKKYNQIVPEKKYININHVKTEDTFGGLFSPNYSLKGLENFKILFLTPEKDVPIETLSVLLHESMHYLDFLMNPKFIRTSNKIELEHSKTSDKMWYFFKEYFYNENNPIKPNSVLFKQGMQKLKHFLKKLSVEEKILSLKYLKQNLFLEQHAYSESRKYAQILQIMKKPYLGNDINCGLDYEFDKKINIINEILCKIIQKERTKKIRKK